MEIKLLIVIFGTLFQRSCQTYISCFRDDPVGSVLTGTQKVFDTTNSPDMCLQYCRERSYLYAGVGKGINCYCGNSFRIHEIVPDLECNILCPGSDDGKFCGGEKASNVYGTGISVSEKGDSRTCTRPECDQECKKLGRTHGYCIETTNKCECSLDSTGYGCPEDEGWCDNYCQQHGRRGGECISSTCRCAPKITADGILST